MSVFELATNIPKLKRVGLVKVVNITDQAIYALVERASTLERLHLSYCDKLTVSAIAFLLNRLTRLTHLSLTGVSAFKYPELKQFCRPAPPVCESTVVGRS
jgi:F-box and leucine-rich repeat protein GRR1